MGCVYQPRYTGRDGTLKVASIWWLKYRDATGRLVREASGTEKKQEAKKLLMRREGASVEGRPTSPQATKVTVGELLADLVNDYTVNGQRVDRLEYSLAHLTPAFAHLRAMQVTTADVNRYIAARLDAKAAPATVNRELAALKRAYSLALRATPPRLYLRPHIPMLQENNVRKGFLEREQFDAVVRHLPEDLRPLVIVAYVTGWRVADELVSMEWHQVDFRAGQLRLEPGETKNKDGRTSPFTPELRAVLEAQRAATDQIQRRRGMVIPRVFHRAGRPIRDFRKAWQNACRAAGVPGRVPHDMRRSSVRTMVRAGVPERVAMQLSGHRTRAVFERYNIVSEADLAAAAEKLSAASGTSSDTSREKSTAPAAVTA